MNKSIYKIIFSLLAIFVAFSGLFIQNIAFSILPNNNNFVELFLLPQLILPFVLFFCIKFLQKIVDFEKLKYAPYLLLSILLIIHIYFNDILYFINIPFLTLLIFIFTSNNVIDNDNKISNKFMIYNLITLIILTIYFTENSKYLFILFLYLIFAYTIWKSKKLWAIIIVILGFAITFLINENAKGISTTENWIKYYEKNEPYGVSYQAIYNQKIISSSDWLSFGKDNTIFKYKMPNPHIHTTLSLLFYNYGKIGAWVNIAMLLVLLIWSYKLLLRYKDNPLIFFAKTYVLIILLFSIIHISNVIGLNPIHSLLPIYSLSREIFIISYAIFACIFIYNKFKSK